MEKATVYQKEPMEVKVEAGETYYWCACGKSAKQPFCDGSHEKTAFAPLAFTPETSGSVHLCGCKQTKNPPYCDGAHKDL